MDKLQKGYKSFMWTDESVIELVSQLLYSRPRVDVKASVRMLKTSLSALT